MSDKHKRLTGVFVQIQTYIEEGKITDAFALFEKVVDTEVTIATKDLKNA